MNRKLISHSVTKLIFNTHLKDKEQMQKYLQSRKWSQWIHQTLGLMFYLSYLFISVKLQQSWNKKIYQVIHVVNYVKLSAKRQTSLGRVTLSFAKLRPVKLWETKKKAQFHCCRSFTGFLTTSTRVEYYSH